MSSRVVRRDFLFLPELRQSIAELVLRRKRKGKIEVRSLILWFPCDYILNQLYRLLPIPPL